MGKDIVVTPRGWSHRGEAELTVKGQPMLVWSGIPGEHERVRVVHQGQNRSYGVFKEGVPPHPHRVEPSCDRYHVCGGCPWMHLSPEGQLDARRVVVQEALVAEGIEIEVPPVVPSPDGDRDYRWVTKLGVGWSDYGRLRVGAWGRYTKTIVPIPQCEVVAPPLRTAMAAVAHHVIDLAIPPYDPENDRGVLRAIVLRGSRATGEVVVTLVAGRSSRVLSDLAAVLMRADAGILGVALHLNDSPGNAIYDRDEEGVVRVRPLDGSVVVEDELDGIRYRIGPGDFFQTNPGMAEVIYRDVIDKLDPGPDDAFVDLYSGVGGVALQAARRAGFTMAVEEIASAADRGREAAKAHDLTVEFLSDRVEEALVQVARRVSAARPLVCVNPARRGLEPEVLDGIPTMRPRRLAYISCNPRALARDLAVLRSHGMHLEELALYDMFPNTPHVECLAVLHADDEGTDASTGRRAPRRRVVTGRREK